MLILISFIFISVLLDTNSPDYDYHCDKLSIAAIKFQWFTLKEA